MGAVPVTWHADRAVRARNQGPAGESAAGTVPGGAASHGPALPESMRTTGTVADWESWTQMRFPETGDFVFPAGLATVHIATVHIDSERDVGEYWEPNVWLIHATVPTR